MIKIENPVIIAPREAYILADGRYMVLGQKPYARGGQTKQSAAVHQSIETALEMMEEHERKYLAIHSIPTSSI